MPLERKKEDNVISYSITLATVITQLKKQGYKLITSNVWPMANMSMTTYIFQKD